MGAASGPGGRISVAFQAGNHTVSHAQKLPPIQTNSNCRRTGSARLAPSGKRQLSTVDHKNRHVFVWTKIGGLFASTWPPEAADTQGSKARWSAGYPACLRAKGSTAQSQMAAETYPLMAWPIACRGNDELPLWYKTPNRHHKQKPLDCRSLPALPYSHLALRPANSPLTLAAQAVSVGTCLSSPRRRAGGSSFRQSAAKASWYASPSSAKAWSSRSRIYGLLPNEKHQNRC